METIVSSILEQGGAFILAALVIYFWREDNKKHSTEKDLLRDEISLLKEQGMERKDEMLEEGKIDRSLLINTLREVATALESITQAVKDSSETIAVASRITDAFVKKMENGNGSGK